MDALNSAFSWLVRASGQASVIIGLVLISQWLFRKKMSPGWRYALWLLVLARLTLPVSPQSPFSVFNILHFHATPFPFATIQPFDYEASKPRFASASETNIQGRESAHPALLIKGNSTDRHARNSPGPTVHSSLFTTLTVLPWIWLSGVCLLALRMSWQNARFAGRVLNQRQVTNSEVLNSLEDCKQWMELRTPLTVIETAEVKSPALYGFIRPRLVLPQGLLSSFTSQELRYVFLHELAHVKRYDMAVNWLVSALRVLHWFNPVIWFAFRRMATDREVAADALALSRAAEADRMPYGQTIIKLLESFTRPAAIPGLVGILEDKQQMKNRIDMIAKFQKSSCGSVRMSLLVVAMGAVCLTDAQTDNADVRLQPISLQRASEVTLRKLPDFRKESRFSVADISPDGRYALGNIIVGDKGSLTLPATIDLITGAERRFDVADDRPGRPTALKFSSNGKLIICARLWEHGSNYTKELLLLDTETGKIKRMYRNDAIETIWFQDWSSDRQTILATLEKERGGQREIALIFAGSGTDRELRIPATHMSPGFCAFSPDGKWIVYEAWRTGKQTADIRLMARDGSKDFALVEHPANDRLLGWPPSSDQIIFMSDRRGGLNAYALSVVDGKPIGDPVLLREIGQGIRPLRFTQSGTFFYKKETSSRDVYFADIDSESGRVIGKPHNAARIEGRNQFPAWSRNGRFLAYTSGGSQDGVIAIRDIESGAVREINSDTDRFSFPHWSPDGRSIFALSYASGKCFAYQVKVESGQTTAITNGVRLIYNEWPLWSWSADGNSFYQRAVGSAFAQFNIETGIRSEIQSPGAGGSTVLSPDCKQLICSVTKRNAAGIVERTINLLPITGGQPRQLVALLGPEAIEEIHVSRSNDEALCWTPDSRYVVFVKGNSNDQRMRSLWRVPVLGGGPEDLGLEMEKLRHPTISSDGRRIAFTAGGNKSEFWVMENFLPPQKTAAK